MNKIIIFIALMVSIVFINGGLNARIRMDRLKREFLQLQAGNLDMKQQIRIKASWPKRAPIPLPAEYGIVLNQVKLIENYRGINMNVQLDAASDAQDIAQYYENSEYKGIKDLKIKLVLDKFAEDTDMGAVLDDIHLIEKNTDFKASEITKGSNNLIVKGEVYGL